MAAFRFTEDPEGFARKLAQAIESGDASVIEQLMVERDRQLEDYLSRLVAVEEGTVESYDPGAGTAVVSSKGGTATVRVAWGLAELNPGETVFFDRARKALVGRIPLGPSGGCGPEFALDEGVPALAGHVDEVRDTEQTYGEAVTFYMVGGMGGKVHHFDATTGTDTELSLPPTGSVQEIVYWGGELYCVSSPFEKYLVKLNGDLSWSGPVMSWPWTDLVRDFFVVGGTLYWRETRGLYPDSTSYLASAASPGGPTTAYALPDSLPAAFEYVFGNENGVWLHDHMFEPNRIWYFHPDSPEDVAEVPLPDDVSLGSSLMSVTPAGHLAAVDYWESKLRVVAPDGTTATYDLPPFPQPGAPVWSDEIVAVSEDSYVVVREESVDVHKNGAEVWWVSEECVHLLWDDPGEAFSGGIAKSVALDGPDRVTWVVTDGGGDAHRFAGTFTWP